jgi:hypothetical protein
MYCRPGFHTPQVILSHHFSTCAFSVGKSKQKKRALRVAVGCLHSFALGFKFEVSSLSEDVSLARKPKY